MAEEEEIPCEVEGCETPAYVPNSSLCPRHLYESRHGGLRGEETRATVRQLVWYGLRDVTEETIGAFERWQEETQIRPMPSTVVVETLPDGRRNYAGAFDASDSYRIAWWLGERGIPIDRDGATPAVASTSRQF